MFNLIWRPDRDHKFTVGERCVLNSGSPLLTVVAVNSDNTRTCSWNNGKETYRFPSICLRPFILDML
jgi:uncharacterized protein YodC (DUF2158 family)